jgi:ABC-type nitrate/sulfonate/bicarbonate transport system substrate-binding protein
MSKMLFVLLMTIFLGSVESRAAEKIRISVSGGYNMIFLSSSVAQHRGFFKDEGLDADIIVMGRRDQSLDQGEPLHS